MLMHVDRVILMKRLRIVAGSNLITELGEEKGRVRVALYELEERFK